MGPSGSRFGVHPLKAKPEMDQAKIRVEVQGPYILVSMRGTCFRARYRKQDAPWLATESYGPEDKEAGISLSEFRALAWAVANEKARELGWVATHVEFHEAVKLAAS
jgi:hypothetical protein